MNIKVIRNLARSNKWMNLYMEGKELGFIKLFHNSSDFTKIQSLFLYWLRIYNSMYSDLAANEDYISEAVIKDLIRSEAYLLLKQEQTKEKKKNTKIDKKNTETYNEIPSVVFTRKGK